MNTDKRVLPVLYIEAVGQGGSAELRVNDLPVGTVGGDGELFTRNIEGFLLPGKNVLTVLPYGKNTTIQSRIVAYRSNEFVDGRGGKTFLFVKSENGEKKSSEGKLSEDRVERSWQSNDRLTDDDKKEAIKAVKKIYLALEKGDIKVLANYLDPVFSDLVGTDPEVGKEAHVKDLTDRIGRLSKEDHWEFKKFNDEQVHLIPVADSRLFDVRREDGTPFFRTDQESKEEWFAIWSMIGRKNGGWKIYR